MKKRVDQVLAGLIASLLGCMVLVACWQVFTRYVLHNPSGITEEILRYMLVWLTMLGGAYAFGQGKQVALVFVIERFSADVQRCLRVVIEVVIGLFVSLALIYGGMATASNAVGQVSPAIGMPMEMLYYSAMVAGAIILFYNVLSIKGYLTTAPEPTES